MKETIKILSLFSIFLVFNIIFLLILDNYTYRFVIWLLLFCVCCCALYFLIKEDNLNRVEKENDKKEKIKNI